MKKVFAATFSLIMVCMPVFVSATDVLAGGWWDATLEEMQAADEQLHAQMEKMQSSLTSEDNTDAEEEEEPILTGDWKQISPQNDGASTFEAHVQDGTIEIDWLFEADNSVALYWAGTFTNPQKSDDGWVYNSENDTSKTSGAMFASGAEIKEIFYSDGKISFQASAMGVTWTAILEKQ